VKRCKRGGGEIWRRYGPSVRQVFVVDGNCGDCKGSQRQSRDLDGKKKENPVGTKLEDPKKVKGAKKPSSACQGSIKSVHGEGSPVSRWEKQRPTQTGALT